MPGDPIDGRVLVSSIRPLSADPASGVESIDEEAFRGVLPGTSLTFLLTLANDAIPRTVEPQFVPIRVVFRGDFRTRLAADDLLLVIPGLNGEGCPGQP